MVGLAVIASRSTDDGIRAEAISELGFLGESFVLDRDQAVDAVCLLALIEADGPWSLLKKIVEQIQSIWEETVRERGSLRVEEEAAYALSNRFANLSSGSIAGVSASSCVDAILAAAETVPDRSGTVRCITILVNGNPANVSSRAIEALGSHDASSLTALAALLKAQWSAHPNELSAPAGAVNRSKELRDAFARLATSTAPDTVAPVAKRASAALDVLFSATSAVDERKPRRPCCPMRPCCTQWPSVRSSWMPTPPSSRGSIDAARCWRRSFSRRSARTVQMS